MGVKVKERPEGSGIWWVFIDHQGRRKAKKIGGDETMAREVAKRIEAKLVLGELNMEKEEKKPSFKEYAEKWLATYIKPLRRFSTHERYTGLLKIYAYPVIGKIPIDQIKRAEIRDLLLGLYGKGLSKNTVSLLRNAISGPLSYARDAELIPVNPVTGLVKALHIETDMREHIDPLTPGEVILFLETAEKHFLEYYPFFLCAFRTGMRLGELLALEWGNIDWNGKFIQVQRSYKLGRFSSTKTGRIRRVDMSDQLIETLHALLTVRKKEGLQMGLGEAVGGVFYRNGLPMEQNHIRHIFRLVLRKAGLREIRVHDARHTFASLLLSDGASLVYVKEQMGHASIETTVDIYGHLIPSSNRASINRLDSGIWQGNTQVAATQAQPGREERGVINENHTPSLFPVPNSQFRI